MPDRRIIRRDLILLAALCALVYATGLTTHGLTNWQESQRVVVAREMQARGDWLVPTINGKPYLAKPPLFYWCQLVIASVRRAEVSIFDLRLTVALAGLLGVLATYWAALQVFQPRRGPPGGLHGDGFSVSQARTAALWSGLCLATGILYVRSSRIGELDILLVPFVAAAVGCVAWGWRHSLDSGRAHWPAVILATACATLAVLTKGPPGLLVVGLAAYGAIAIWAAWTPSIASRLRPRAPLLIGGLLGGACATGAVVLNVLPGGGLSAKSIAGLVLIAALGVGIGIALSPLPAPVRAKACFVAYSRTHPVLVLGFPLLTLWAWGRAVDARLAGTASTFAVQEAEDNLRLLVPESPVINLEASAYGVGLGSILAILGLIWLVRNKQYRRWEHPIWLIPVAWTGLGIAAFSLLGKGVPRYLTPVWPGIAMVAGLYVSHVLARAKKPGVLRACLVGVVVGLAAGQAVWYGVLRDQYERARSPRDFVAELLRTDMPEELRTDPASLATFEFRTPAVDYYAGRFVQPVGDIEQRNTIAGTTPWTIEQLREHVAKTGRPMTLLVRAGSARAKDAKPDPREVVDRLSLAGFVATTLPVQSRFTIDSGRTFVGAVRVAIPGTKR